MIELKKDGQIIYENLHLGEEKIETYSGILNRLDKLDSNLFYNIVSSPQCRYEKNYGENRVRSEFREMSPKDRFENILKSKIFFGSPKGFFVDKSIPSIKPTNIPEIVSTSFTFCDMLGLIEHFKARNSEFGFCFNHEFLQKKGIRSVIYLNDNDLDSKEKYIFNSPHLLEVFSSKYDMRWENEWRINGDVSFDYEDIAFVIVPYEYYDYYINYFVDNSITDQSGYEIPIVTSSTYTSHLNHFLQLPFMDNSWGQVRVFGSDGFKIDPYRMMDLNNLEFTEFSKKYRRELKCLAKNTILNVYETRYIERFLCFLSKIDRNTQIIKSYKFDNYKHNRDEPYQSERDLVMELTTELYIYLNTPSSPTSASL